MSMAALRRMVSLAFHVRFPGVHVHALNPCACQSSGPAVLDALSESSLSRALEGAIWLRHPAALVVGGPRVQWPRAGLGQVVDILGLATTQPGCPSVTVVACQPLVREHTVQSPSLCVKHVRIESGSRPSALALREA